MIKIIYDCRKSVIYEILNRKTGNAYIGATACGVFSRFSNHFNKLIQNKHENDKFQKEWNLYNPEDWSFRILEYNIDCENSRERETHWIQMRNGLNIAPKSSKQIKNEKYWRVASDLHKNKKTYREIAIKYNISLGSVSGIAKRFGLSRRTIQKEYDIEHLPE